MKNGLIKKILPHLIAVIIFLVISIFFCKPALDGNVLNQSDITHWKAIAKNAFDYKEKNGHYPLWNPALFGGMPNYQVIMEGKSILPDITKIMSAGLPKPMNYFFLSCVCFYILCMALRIKPVIAIFGSIAFAFSTYNPIIIGVGHESKMLAIAFMPLLLAGILLVYEKRYWIGLALTTLGAYQEIAANHPQINYFFLLIAAAVTIAYAVGWIKRKEWKHMAISGLIVIGTALIAVGATAVSLFTTYEYTKTTMRGGKDINISEGKVETTKTSGLDTAYAFQYSYGQAETITMLMPKAYGEHSGKTLDENSNVVSDFAEKGYDGNQAMTIVTNTPSYWGGIGTVAGPVYYGVIICLLALIGFVVVRHPLRWALLAVSILAILMSWGKYLPSFNAFLFDALPFYNKFRAPSMLLVITEFTIPLMAMLCLHQLLFREKSREMLKADFKKILYAVGGLFVFLLLMYVMQSYESADRELDNALKQGIRQFVQNDDIYRTAWSGIKADRKEMFGGQMLRAFGFGLFMLAVLFLYMRGAIKPIVVALALAIVTTIELLAIDSPYLNEDKYTTPEDIEATNFVPNQVESQILADKDPDFRVYNQSVNMLYDARTSAFFKSVGGYHPARLRIYQDLIDQYFMTRPVNPNILNMMNTKYLLEQDRQGNMRATPNPDAYGACWLVKGIKMVKDPAEEIQVIGATNLKDTAVVQDMFKTAVTQPQWDSAATISIKSYDPDAVEYSFNASKPQFAVFSEVYYPYGWNAYIDGKKTEYAKVDYVLRGLSIPAGQHTIRFAFEPASYKKGVSIAYISSFLILILVLGGFFMEWRSTRFGNSKI